MSTAAPPDLAALKRASRFAALVTLIGAGLALASIGYSVWRLADTESDLTQLKREVHGLTATKDSLEASVSTLKDQEQALQMRVKQVLTEKKAIEAEKQALERDVKDIAASIPPLKKGQPKKEPPPIQQIKDAVEERAELEKQVMVLRKEANLIREKLKQEFADPKKNLEFWAKPQFRGVMTTVLVKPTSRYLEKNDPSSPTGKWYRFILELAFPADAKLAATIKRDIKSVSYELNHPYLRIDPLVSTAAGKDFAVNYQGAGTLRNVVVKIDVDGAGVVALDYDMTKAHPEAAAK